MLCTMLSAVAVQQKRLARLKPVGIKYVDTKEPAPTLKAWLIRQRVGYCIGDESKMKLTVLVSV